MDYIEKEKYKYRKLVANKKNKEEKRILEEVENKIVNAYELFHFNMINNVKIDPIVFERDEIKKILIKNYCNNSSVIKQIKKEVREDNIRKANNKCLYCMIGDIRPCDHYFPKEKYPEYSILSNNLIYVCDACNSDYKSNNKLYDECGNRNYYNLYYDKKIEYKFLYINISLNNGIKFEVTLNFKDEGDNTVRVIENHFKNLNLFTRFKSKCSNKLNEIKNLDFGSDVLEFKKIMKAEYDKMVKTYGDNYWESAFYYSLKNLSEEEVLDFVNYLAEFN